MRSATALFAIAGGKFDQRVEVGLLALEPAVEGADRGADLGAQGFDREFRQTAAAQHFGAGHEQRGGHLTAALLP